MSKRKKKPSMFLRILAGFAIWFVSVIAIAAIGTVLKFNEQGGPLYSILVVVVPVALAVLLASPKKNEVPLTELEIIPTAPTKNPADTLEPQTQTQVAEKPTQDTPDDIIDKTYRVTGIQHYLDNLLDLAVPNSNYDMTKKEIIDFGMTDQYIWECEFYPSKLELQPEPDNPHDSNAIKVLIDDKHVGYIKSGSCKHLLNVIEQDRFMGATCKIGGGKYKRVDEEYDYDRDKSTYTLDKGEKNFSIVLTIKEKRK